MKAFIILFSFFLCLVNIAAADDAIKISGFGTLAITTSDSDTLGFRRNFHSGSTVYKDTYSLKQDSVFGVQANVDITDDLRGVVQLLAKDRLENSVENAFNFAFLEYTPVAGLAVRAGRVPLDIFLLADYREVNFAYLWVRPPSDLYRTLFYDYYDGAEIRYSQQLGEGLAEVKCSVGKLDAVLPLDIVEEVTFSFKPIWGINARYTVGSWRFIGGFQRGTIQNISEQITVPQKIFSSFSDEQYSLSSSLADELKLDDSDTDYLNAGIAYEAEPWHIQGELCRYRFDKALGVTYTCGYLSAGYTFGAWTPFIMLSKITGDIDRSFNSNSAAQAPPQIQMAADAVMMLIHDVYADEKTVSFGVRWDLYQNIAVKFQWNHSQVKGGYSAFWKRDQPAVDNRDEEVNLATLALSFVF